LWGGPQGADQLTKVTHDNITQMMRDKIQTVNPVSNGVGTKEIEKKSSCSPCVNSQREKKTKNGDGQIGRI